MARVGKEWFLGLLQASVQIGGGGFVDVGQGCSMLVAAPGELREWKTL
jgi:hypothetical protein